jgi:hypothetical protein
MTMKVTPKVWMYAIVLGIAFGGQSVARAQTCASGCGAEKRACVQAARIDKLACKVACREAGATAGLGACLRSCTGAFRDAKTTCRDDHTGCRTDCSSPNPPADPACPGSCGGLLGQCARGVAAQAHDCVKGCRTAPDRRLCLEGCADTAGAGRATCAADFATCRAACGGSPSTAFVD